MMQGAAVHTGAGGIPVDFDLADIDIEFEEETEEVKKEITIIPQFMWTKQQQKPHRSTTHMEGFAGEIDLGSQSRRTESLTIAKQASGSLLDEKDYNKLSGVNPVVAKLTFTRAQEEDLLQAFNLLDHTGEGKIKADDFRVAIKALGYEPTKEELQHMVNEVDKGHSGKLSFKNFTTAIARKVLSRDSDADIMKSFRLFDNDDVGLISFDNVKRVTQVIGTYLTDEEIEEMIDDADKDYDGYVNSHEFMRMIKNAVKIVTP